MKKEKEEIEDIISEYISLQDRVEILTMSSRLAAKEDAARLTIAAGELHTRLQDIIEERMFGTKTDGVNRLQNREEVAKIIGFCRELGIPKIYAPEDSFYLSFDFEDDFSISLEEKKENKIETCMEMKEIVSCDMVTSDQYLHSAQLTAPNVEMASAKLKNFAQKFGYKLKSYVTGSFHQQFGVVCVDFKSKES